MAQARGRKQFILFPPEDTQYLCDGKGFCNPRAVDQARFPNYSRARPYRAVLEQGDVLFVPEGWSHEVTCLTDSISITYNFLPIENFRAFRLAFLLHKTKKVAAKRKRRQETKAGVHQNVEDRNME